MSEKPDSKYIAALRVRLIAAYHNLLSSAAFKREEAFRCEDENEAMALRREACAFEYGSQWIISSLDIYDALEKKGGVA